MGFFDIKSESGKCGENLRWELFLGTLTISGTGRMNRPAFRGFESLTSVTIGNSATEIGYEAFSCCGLTSVTIPDSVEKIGKYAFHNCKNLTSVTIPDSVKEVGSGAFYGCTNLRKISYSAGTEFDWELSSGNDAELIPY